MRAINRLAPHDRHENDALIPVASFSPNTRERLPQATFVILPDVAHDQTMDEPQLVACTILKAAGASKE